MMKATGLKRGSRKKQQQQQTQPQHADKEDPAQRSVGVTVIKQPQPILAPETMEQHAPRRKQNEEVTALTTKNYRLAKELADLRLRHRDECKNVTRLTMENMNLASRCREAISHVAMLKRELSMQQKRTAAALASQREQTQRIADSLTNSMELSRLSRSSSDDVDEVKEDNNLTMIETATQSPDRAISRASDSPCSSKSPPSSSPRPFSPPEEARDSPPADSSPSPSASGSSLDEDDVDDTAETFSTVTNSPTEPAEQPVKTTIDKKEEHVQIVYSTPKRGERWAPNFGRKREVEDHSEHGGVLFPISASPFSFKKSYNEGFPSDIVDQSNRRRREGADGDLECGEEGDGILSSITSQQRKINLLNSIDAFEKSFSVDFPESFTPKDGSNSGRKNHKNDIYNPFFATPERQEVRSKRGTDPFSNDEETKAIESPLPFEQDCKVSHFETPPRVPRVNVRPIDGEPPRPEKTLNSAARARYEQALQPRPKTTNTDKTGQSNGTQNQMHNKQNSDTDSVLSKANDTNSEEDDSYQNRIIDIVDAFEGKPETALDPNISNKESNRVNLSISTRMSLRRNIKQPLSYAEPPLNTKLRKGDTFFPKMEDQNPTPVVTPPSVTS